MTARRRIVNCVCAIAWSLLLLQLLTAFFLTYFDSVSIWDSEWPWMSWPIVSELLPFSFVFGFVTVLCSTTVLVIVRAAERESKDPVWRIQKPGIPNSNKAKS